MLTLRTIPSQNIPARFKARVQFNNQAPNIVHAVQSKAFLANRRGNPFFVSAFACLAASLG